MANETLVLGIETSCDETAAAIVGRDGVGRGRILASVVRAQWQEHAAFGGVVPEIAARAHVSCLDDMVREAMRTAGIAWHDLSAVAVTAGPGLVGGLIVGVVTAKAIAMAAGLPLVGVNHLAAHALTVGLTDGVRPPYLLLLVSGGHTQTLAVHAVDRYTRIGTTIDDALGEAFDKTAKLLGLGQPGGPAVERAAERGDPRRFHLPRPMFGRIEPHFSFAGLKTAVRNQAQQLSVPTARDIDDLCASFQAAVAASVTDRVCNAMRIYEELEPAGRRVLVVAGGVAANRHLGSVLRDLAGAEGYRVCVPPVALCGDNAAMVAWAGAEMHELGRHDGLDLAARARWPLDGVAAPVLGSGRLGGKA